MINSLLRLVLKILVFIFPGNKVIGFESGIVSLVSNQNRHAEIHMKPAAIRITPEIEKHLSRFTILPQCKLFNTIKPPALEYC